VAAFSNFRPLIITFHGSDLNSLPGEKLWRRLLKKSLSNLAVLRAKKIICVSAGIRENLWWKKQDARIIPLGINITEFKPMDRKEARRELGWNENEVVVLFNANNPKIKRLDIAEQAIAIIRKSIPDARLEILRGTDNNHQQIPLIINASDCLLICSDSEGSPMMVKEALACGVPVAGVDVGDVRERLTGAAPSRIAEQNPVSLAAAIIDILHADEPSTGRAKLLADNLTEEAVAGMIHDLYLGMIK
jgi:teichuronic acid biosynthesis glycosyltransferase TuaC